MLILIDTPVQNQSAQAVNLERPYFNLCSSFCRGVEIGTDNR
jgi:hypothetical protein